MTNMTTGLYDPMLSSLFPYFYEIIVLCNITLVVNTGWFVNTLVRSFCVLTDYSSKSTQSSKFQYLAKEKHNSANQLLWNCRQDAPSCLLLSSLPHHPPTTHFLPPTLPKNLQRRTNAFLLRQFLL